MDIARKDDTIGESEISETGVRGLARETVEVTK